MRLRGPGGIVIGVLSLWGLVSGSFRLYYQSFFNNEPAQVILVLGGDVDREYVGLKLANELKLPLLISGGSNPEHAEWLVDEFGIPRSLVRLDYRASDTFGNFTSLVDDLYKKGVTHLILVTSSDHFARAISVGQVIAGSKGIRLSGVAVSCAPLCQKESLYKRIFDGIRSIVWVVAKIDLKILIYNQL